MRLRCLLGLIVLSVFVTALPGQGAVPGVAQVLVVIEVDRSNGRILFATTAYETRIVKKEGKEVTEKVPISVKHAFSLKEGKAITADGKAVAEADLWKRVEVGKPVVILSPQAREFEDLDQPIRALFKGDTILLVGSTKPLPKGKDGPKKP